MAFIVIIGIATLAVYLVGNKGSETQSGKTAGTEDKSTVKAKPSKSQTNKKAQSKPKGKAAKKESEEEITNSYDKTISKDLDDAENLLKTKKIEKAKRAFEQLVKGHPNSPRAMYGLARSLDNLADSMRSNQILQEAIDTYEKVGKVKDCPSPLKRLAVLKQAERVSFLGKSHIAVKVLDNLAKDMPQDVEVWNKLGIQCLMSGNQNKAKKAFTQVL